MRLNKTQHDSVIGPAFNAENAIHATVEFFDLFGDRAAESFAAFQCDAKIDPCVGPLNSFAIETYLMRNCRLFAKVHKS